MQLSMKLALGLVAVAFCLSLAGAQKSPARGYQQQFGSNQESAYGGYQAAPRSPVQRRPQQQQQQQQPQQQQNSYSAASSNTKQQSYQAPPKQEQQQESSYEESASQQSEADAEPATYGAVSGSPGKDFPAYTQVPKTSFSCEGLPYEYGMYADEETGCQAYHVCYNGRKDSFLCGVGTVFNQRILHCDYWYSVDCGKSSQYYGANAYMGSSQPEPGPAEAGVQPAAQRPSKDSYGQQSAPRPANAQRSKTNSYNRQPQQQQYQPQQQQQQQQYQQQQQESY